MLMVSSRSPKRVFVSTNVQILTHLSPKVFGRVGPSSRGVHEILPGVEIFESARVGPLIAGTQSFLSLFIANLK